MNETDQQAETSADQAAPTTIDDAADTMMGTLSEIWHDFVAHLPLMLGGVVILVLTWVVAAIATRVTRRITEKSHVRQSLQDLIERLVVIAVWVIGLLLAAMVVFPGLTPTKALAALGVGSIAIGFAFKDIFENFFAGILILWRFPFEIDDFIECEGIMGRVEQVTVRNTLIRTVEGELVIVPNAVIFKNPVNVLTDQDERRITVIGGVGYGEDIDRARSVITDAVEGCGSIASDRPVQIFAREFGDSSVNFEITWWTGATPLEQRKSRDEIVAAVKRALDDAGIEIPFPYRTLTFSEALTVRNQGAPQPQGS